MPGKWSTFRHNPSFKCGQSHYNTYVNSNHPKTYFSYWHIIKLSWNKKNRQEMWIICLILLKKLLEICFPHHLFVFVVLFVISHLVASLINRVAIKRHTTKHPIGGAVRPPITPTLLCGKLRNLMCTAPHLHVFQSTFNKAKWPTRVYKVIENTLGYH